MVSFRRTSTATIALVTCLLISGCGGGADDEGRTIADRSIVAKAKPLENALIPESTLERYQRDSVQRAFYEYWSSLQWQAFKNAADYYRADLREFVGYDDLLVALIGQGGYFRSSRPEIARVSVGNGETIVRYRVTPVDGDKQTLSQSWRRVKGRWRITYDPFLDTALAQAAQLERQAQIDPSAQKPSSAAVRAGNAARRLQARYAASLQARASQPQRPVPTPTR